MGQINVIQKNSCLSLLTQVILARGVTMWICANSAKPDGDFYLYLTVSYQKKSSLPVQMGHGVGVGVEQHVQTFQHV